MQLQHAILGFLQGKDSTVPALRPQCPQELAHERMNMLNMPVHEGRIRNTSMPISRCSFVHLQLSLAVLRSL